MTRRRFAPRALGLAALALTVAGLAYIRVSAGDPAEWHADPLEMTRTERPNDFQALPPGKPGDIESPVFAMPAAELARRFDAVALAQPRTRRLAGDPAQGWTTYVQRSLLIGWPDYISARAVDLGEGRSALAVWSRSRYGYSDWGVNRARVEAWLAALEQG